MKKKKKSDKRLFRIRKNSVISKLENDGKCWKKHFFVKIFQFPTNKGLWRFFSSFFFFLIRGWGTVIMYFLVESCVILLLNNIMTIYFHPFYIHFIIISVKNR